MLSLLSNNVRALLVWLCGGLFYGYQFSLRVSAGSMSEDLMRDFGVQSCALGILGAFYYNAYASLQVPIGLMLDRFGSHRMIPFSISLCAAGAFLFSVAQGLTEASVARLLMGAGSACGFIGTIKLITLWFPPHRKALMIGLTMTLGTIGASLGTAQLPVFLSLFGWRVSMQGLGIIGALLALVSFFLMTKPPQENQVFLENQSSQDEETSSLAFLEGLKIVVLSPQVWLLALFGCLMYVPLAALADLWGIPYLTTLYKIDRDTAGLYISAIFWGVCLGGLVVSYLSDRYECRRPFMMASTLLCLITYSFVILYPGISPAFMIAFLFMGGFFFGGQVLCFSCITESLPLWTSGVAVGFANMIIMSSGVIFEPLVGYLLDRFWTGEKIKGVPVYTADIFQKALIPVLLSLFVAFVITIFIKETFPKKSFSFQERD